MNNKITMKATMDNLDYVLEFVERNLNTTDCPMKITMKIVLCIEELYVNIVNYAYDGYEGDCTICMEVPDDIPNKVKITITDQGKYFNLLEQENPDITLDADERDIGGLGIFMVKSTMDKIDYERKEGDNVIVLEKSW